MTGNGCYDSDGIEDMMRTCRLSCTLSGSEFSGLILTPPLMHFRPLESKMRHLVTILSSGHLPSNARVGGESIHVCGLRMGVHCIKSLQPPKITCMAAVERQLPGLAELSHLQRCPSDQRCNREIQGAALQ